jgi:hypothetical protein
MPQGFCIDGEKLYIRILSTVFFILLISIFFKCATRGNPGGGPVDKTPPSIIYTFPAIDSLGVNKLEEIQIYFSERMDENSVRKALFISPPFDYEIDWSGGDELTLEISSDSLEVDQTYVITLGSDAQDSRKNRMKESYQFAFSTGNYLDPGKISGKIYKLKKNDLMNIYAYELVENDTIDPRYQSARFLTQSGEDGTFQLSYLPLGNYRIFVVEDQNNNLILDAAYERVGIATHDVFLDSSNLEVSGLNFMLTKIDTSAPFITSARAIYNNTVLLRASEELRDIMPKNITIIDTLNNNLLQIKGISESVQSSSQYFLYTELQDSSAYYKIKVVDIADTNNNYQIEPSIVYFSGQNKSDTSSFELKNFLPPDSTTNFSIFSDIRLEFSLPVDTKSVINNFRFIGGLTDTLIGKWKWQELKKGSFRLFNELEPGIDYRMILHTGLINSIWGDTLSDTLFSHIVSTISPDDYGSISGRIKIDTAKYSQLYLRAQSAKGKKQSFKPKKSENSVFRFDWLNEGSYIFNGYLDIDNNKKWSPGNISPFQFAEPVFFQEDTIRVRKRWETSDVLVQVPGW